MTVYHFPELTDESALYWLAMDTWKPYDAAWLLCGIDPHGMERSYGAFATELCTQMCGDHPASKAAFQIVELLKSSEKAGRIAFPAAPGDVIAWAKAKKLRLSRQFLDVQFGGTEQTAPAAGGAGNPSNEAAIPGKLPNTSMGKLAIKAAWQIEGELKRAATAKQVMTRLQEWADGGHEPATLLKSDKKNHAVIWITGKRVEKSYDTEACGKTLEIWMASRA
jgi:hypothetical protein